MLSPFAGAVFEKIVMGDDEVGKGRALNERALSLKLKGVVPPATFSSEYPNPKFEVVFHSVDEVVVHPESQVVSGMVEPLIVVRGPSSYAWRMYPP